MPRACKTCIHPQRAEIDMRLARGESAAAVAKDFGVPAANLLRHMNHVAEILGKRGQESDRIAVEMAQMEATLMQELTAKIDLLAKEAVRLKGVAIQLADMRSALALLRELTRINEMKLKAKELEQRAFHDDSPNAPGALLSPAAARKMAETYLTRHHIGERLRELKGEADAE